MQHSYKNGAWPSGKATGFGPVIAKVRILSSQMGQRQIVIFKINKNGKSNLIYTFFLFLIIS